MTWDLNNMFETMRPWLYIGVIMLSFLLFPFWWALLALFIFYMLLSLWELYKNPSIFIVLEGFIPVKEGEQDDRWYAKAIRFMATPIYWFVDKSKERWEREDVD